MLQSELCLISSFQGGVIAINIDWDCNLDFGNLYYCTPDYSFRRIDRKDSHIAPGWNFRYGYKIYYTPM